MGRCHISLFEGVLNFRF